MADYDWGGAESALKEKAGQWYDPTMLQDLQRNVSYGQGENVDQGSVNDWVSRIGNKAQLRGSNEANSTYEANGRGGVTVGPTGKVNDPMGTGGGGGQSTTQQWNNSQNDYTNQLLQQMMEQQRGAADQNRQRGDALYGQLMQRATQGTNVDKNDPVIRAQTEAFTANTDRAQRNYLADRAESLGPYSSGAMRGEGRMATERAGQAAGGFQAQLMGRELTARRDEIQNALSGMQGMLSADQTRELQKQLGLLNHSIQQQGIGLGQQGLGLQAKGMENQQNNFYDTLGLQAENQANTWDWMRSGGGSF